MVNQDFKKNTNKASTLQNLLQAQEPFVTVKKLTEIANECNVDYETIVGFINGCRMHHDEIRKCLFSIAQKYRPDILKVINRDKAKEVLGG
ncbi:MAG: hypothetical protein RLN62_05410 [Rickettsiales bacterium]